MATGDALRAYSTNLNTSRSNVNDLRGRVESMREDIELARRGLQYVQTVETQADDFLHTIRGMKTSLQLTERVGPLSVPSRAIKTVLNALEDVTRQVRDKAHQLNQKIEDGQYIQKLRNAENRLQGYENNLLATEIKLLQYEASTNNTIAAFDLGGSVLDPVEGLADGVVSPLNTVLGEANAIYSSVTGEIDNFLSIFNVTRFMPAIDVANAFRGINGALSFLDGPLNAVYAALRPVQGLLDAVGFVYSITVGPVVDWVLDTLGITAVMDRISAEISALLPDANVLQPLHDAIDGMFVEVDNFLAAAGWNTEIADFVDRFTDIIFPDMGDTASGIVRFGTQNDDTLMGRDGVDDILDPHAGNDQVFGLSGNDIIMASAGDDTIWGGDGTADRLILGDTLFAYDFSRAHETAPFVFHHKNGRFGLEIAYDIEIFVFADRTMTASELLNNVRGISGGSYTGTAADELIYATTGSGAVTINGAGGNDELRGSDNADVLNGDAGNDRLVSNRGADTLDGGAGNDTWVYAMNPSSNSLTQVDLATGQSWDGDSRDTLISIENITMEDNRDSDLFGDGAANVIIGGSARDWIDGRAGNDSLIGGSGQDLLIGGPGIDTLRGGDHSDKLVASGTSTPGAGELYDGGAGFDTLIYSSLYNEYRIEPRQFTPITVPETSGPLHVNAGNGRIDRLDRVGGTSVTADIAIGIENYIASDHGDILLGAAPAPGDQLFIDGAGGDDTLYSYGATETRGGQGDDLMYAVGGQSFDGGAGIDTLDTRLMDARWYIRLEGSIGSTLRAFAPIVSDDFADGSGNDRSVEGGYFGGNLSNTEIIILDQHDDEVILRNSGQMTIHGGDGNDRLTRDQPNDGSGDATLYGEAGNDILTLRQGGTLDGGTGDDTLSVNGSGSVHTALGGSGDDTVLVRRMGHGTNSVADGGAGFDRIAFDVIDRINETNERSVIDLRAGTAQSFLTNSYGEGVGNLDISIANFEVVLGNSFRDMIIGRDSNERLGGRGGNDTLQGNGGRDELFGGDGDDSILGGAGDDLLHGGAGNNTLVGGAGTDMVSYVNATPTADDGSLVAGNFSALTADLSTGVILHSSGRDIVAEVAGVTGGWGHDRITGNSADNVLAGEGGNDTLLGLGGDDVLLLGEGDDSADGGSGDDRIVVGIGTDAIDGGSGFDTLDMGNFSGTVTVNASQGVYTAQVTQDRPVFADAPGAATRVVAGQTLTPQDVLETQPEYANDTGDLTRVITDSTGTVRIAFQSVTTTHTGSFAGIEAIVGGLGDDSIDGRSGVDSLNGGSGSDVVRGGGGADTVDGGSGRDTVQGGAGDDTIQSLNGAEGDVLDGGAGFDRLLVGHAGGIAVDLAQGTLRDRGATGQSTLTGIEAVYVRGNHADLLTGSAAGDRLHAGGGNDTVFGGAGHDTITGGLGDDLLHGGLLVNPFDGAAARAYRMYEATLGRTPDHAGHLGWIARLNNGMSAEQAAGHFVGSAEFTQRYGALDNGAFVSQLYVNVLNRQADSAGLNAWVAQLNAGASRAQVVLGFSESAEFVGRTGPEALRYSYAGYQESFADDVFRLYRATLARDPDAAGLEGWAGQLAGGRAQAQVAAGFVASAEFQQTYGNTSDSQFINLLYQNVLGRGADGAGLQGWQDRLNGGWSRADVVLGFAQSTEFVRATGAALKGWMRSQGTDDVLAGNGGQDVLFGGLWADEFHFDRGDTGRAVVVDLEGWDRVKLSGFGYASASEARSHMNQSGSDVVFTDQGTTAVFLNTQLAQIADDMILTA